MPTNKYFACPFCTERLTREDMVTHIERKHEAELPEGFTPLRATFHAVNRKDMKYRRPCRICRKPTDWDENKGRYNFLCNNPNCKKLWIQNMKDTMGDKYGAYRPTTSAKGLEKMLAGRKISGKYKFSTGGEVPYTGSYEKKALEFMDLVLGVKMEDIEVPGPAIKYPYKGEEHIYIPDIYYRPYNLIIEVKDGGKNPNTHPGFSDVRARKIAKEKHVINNTKYNYIRLTDNNFAQLLAVFADLKFHLVNDDRNKVAHVNEAAELAANTIKEHMGVASIAPIVGFTPGDAVILTKPMNRVFAVTDSPYFEKVVTLNHKGMLGYQDKDEFGDDYKMYVKKDCMPNIDKALKKYIGKELSESTFYELVFGHPMYSSDQLLFEDMICLSDLQDKMYEDIVETTLDLIGFNEKMEEFKAGGFDQYKSTFFSENDMKYNYDAFVKGSTDILFISGVIAKGKADYAEDIANQYGADVIHLDDVEHNKRYSDKKLREKHILIYKYFCDTEEGVESREKKKKDPEVDLYETVPNFLQFFLANRDPHKRYIIVGSQLMDLLAAGRISFDILEKYAIILKDTSVIQTKSQVDDIQSKDKIFELLDDYVDYMKSKVKKASYENLPKNLKKKLDNDKPLDDIVKDALGEATDTNKPVISKPYFIKSSDGVDNACVDIQGYDHPCRGRSSMLILKLEDDTWKVFLSKDEEKNHEYHAPGGGWNKGESPKDAAIREAQEEVYINVKDVKYEGFLLEYHEEVQEWVKDHVSDSSKWWYGYYSEIYVGMYDSKFTGEVKDIDKDQMANSGKWYNFEDIKDDFTPVEYKEAIESYIEKVSNPSYVNENTLFNAKDIYHNKDKFDSGEINLCFITGHSGSGKSTMGRGMGTDVQHYELDDVAANWNFSDENLKEYGNLIYTFFKTVGKKFRYTSEEDFKKGNNPLDDTGNNYDKELINAFVNYAKAYANAHKNEKFVVEGIQLFLFIPPESIKDYAVYIKGTSAAISAYRAAKRDSENDGLKGFEKVKGMAKMLTNKKTNNNRMENEKLINKYRNYFKEDTDMVSYTNLLEFFMENGIQLDSEQMENLKDICEDSYSLDTFYCTEDDTIDLTSDLLPVLEITEEDLKKNMDLSPVFVMLSFNGGLVGKVIKGYGKDLGWEYSHSSISLLPSLSTLYSFNITKSTDEEDKKHKYNGLAIEHFRDFRDNPKCKIKVIAILVDTETRNKIKKAIQYYIDNIDKTRYATKSLGKALMGTGEKIQNYGNMTLFCSQFVDAVLKQANIDIGGRGSSVNTHPSELGQFKDKNNYFTVYEGPASGYDEEKIMQKITYMKQTMDHKDLNAITDRTGTVDVNDHRVENRAKQYIDRKIQKVKDNRAAKKEKPIPLDEPLSAT